MDTTTEADAQRWIEDTLNDRMGRGVRLGPKHLWGELFLVDQALGHPGRNIRCIQVVGTNGKGSTSSMLAHALRHAQRKVGLYTSPHLHRVQERIRIDMEPVRTEPMAAAMRRVIAAEAEVKASLSFFELLTFSALLCFVDAEVEDMVLEAGLGGRLDATSIRRSHLCLITPIALDHQNYLGDSLLKIAGEKAAVMHSRAPVFVAEQKSEIFDFLRDKAVSSGITFRESTPLAEAPNPNMAAYQRVNAGLAMDALAYLCPQEVPKVHREVLASELYRDYHWPGRMEWISCGKGAVLLDVAHNPEGLSAILRSLDGASSKIDWVYVAAMADKDVPLMIEMLNDAQLSWSALRFEDAQAFDFERLGMAEEDILAQSEAICEIKERALRGEGVLVFGSHRWVAKVRESVLEEGEGSEVQTSDGLHDPLRRSAQTQDSPDSNS